MKMKNYLHLSTFEFKVNPISKVNVNTRRVVLFQYSFIGRKYTQFISSFSTINIYFNFV